MKNLNLIIVIFLAFITVSCNSNYKLTEKTPKLKYEMAQPQIRHYQKTDLKQTVKSITETTNADNLN
jgi:hypothetical protein